LEELKERIRQETSLITRKVLHNVQQQFLCRLAWDNLNFTVNNCYLLVNKENNFKQFFSQVFLNVRGQIFYSYCHVDN
jgi:hypothetical protein